MTGATDPDISREQAREILSGRDYRPTSLPRPFRGALQWLGRQLEPVVDLLGRIFGWIAALPLVWRVLLLAAVVAVVAAVAVHVARLRAQPARRRLLSSAVDDAPQDPVELERLADLAESEGDYDLALRYRFRAGLLRLDRNGLVAYRPSITSGEVSRALRLAPFDELARRHDEVTYGGRGATKLDVEEARATWPALVRSR